MSNTDVKWPDSTLQQTKCFMLAAGQEVPSEPKQPSYETAMLRLSLCLEELYELAQAMGVELSFQKMLLQKVGLLINSNNTCVGVLNAQDTHQYDPVAVLDALADSRVVADGAVLATGLQGPFEAAMQEVYASNMSKFSPDLADALATQAHYAQQGVETYMAAGEHWPKAIYRAADKKVLKSITYHPAQLAPLLEPYTPATT